MALPAKKYYKGAPANALLTSSPSSGDTTMTVDTITGWPTSFPFYVVIDPGTSKEEKVRVTAISTLTLTVVRAQDNTSAVGHTSGAAIYPVFTAIEASEANEVASVMTTKGDLITNDGTTINRLAVGATNTHVLQVDSTATNGIKWGQVDTAGIADSAVTSAKIADGTIVNADINASAAIALSKLATGALPSGITVASANLVDGTVAAADIATAALKLLCPVGTIAAYGGTSAPTGWLLCDGTSTTGYTELAALVGSTTPNMKGRVAVGRNTSDTDFNDMFETGGAKTHTLTTSEMPSHQHGTGDNFLDNATMGGATSNRYAVVGGGGATPGISSGFTSNTGGGGAHNNLQPYIVVNYIIKHDY